MTFPSSQDYLDCFHLYQQEMDSIYLQNDEEGRYELLFERILRMLIQSSPFNTEVPLPFRRTAQKYLNGDEEARRYMSQPEKRNFMLSDLYDFVTLYHKMHKHTL